MIKKIFSSRLIKVAITIILILFVVILVLDKIITKKTEAYCYEKVEDISENKVGLILGTSETLSNGSLNPYFTYRIKAAKDLYEAGKVSRFVVSGDNSRPDYNEPEDMKNALISLGIPDEIIYSDYAGLRTLDSVIRMKEIFGQNKFTIISQKFHNERAIFISQHYGLDVIAYNAKDVEGNFGFKTMVREKLARIKVMIDILINKQPRYLGDKIEIS